MTAAPDGPGERERIGDVVAESGLLSRRKIIIQLLGFAVGVALLYWCIDGAIRKGGWEPLAKADRSVCFTNSDT